MVLFIVKSLLFLFKFIQLLSFVNNSIIDSNGSRFLFDDYDIIKNEYMGEVALDFRSLASLKQMVIPFSISGFDYKMNITIDIGFSKTIIPMDISEISSGSKETIKIDQNEYESIVIIKNVIFGDSRGILSNLQMNLINNTLINQPILGLGRLLPLYNRSIMNNIHYHGLNTPKQFTLFYHSYHKGIMILGKRGIIEHKPELRRSCQAIDTLQKEKWSCLLNGMYFGSIMSTKNNDSKNYSIRINQLAIFETVEDMIFVPFNFLIFIKATYLNNHIKSSQCEMRKIIEYELAFYCKKRSIDQLEKIHFVFGNFSLILHPKQLFIEKLNDEYYKFIICSNANKLDWTFGAYFLSQYITTFNYDNDIISFFSFNHIEDIIHIDYTYDITDKRFNSNERSIIAIYQLSIILLSLGFITISILYLLINKSNIIKKY